MTIVVCGQSIYGHYSLIVGIIAKYYIYFVVLRSKQVIVGIYLVGTRVKLGNPLRVVSHSSEARVLHSTAVG